VSDWESLHPDDAAGLLHDLDAPWWIAGGWSLDLFLGRQVRPHKDLDVAVLRRDQRRVFDALPGWELAAAHDGGLEPWDGALLPADRHGLWARPRGAERWQLELVLDEADGETWRYRRDPRVTRPIASLGPSGGPQPPEVALLYKAREPGHEGDWDAVVGRLDAVARAWLADAVACAHPESPYRDRL
jgi:Aminoglycoside-2''-adenylyltransferase